MKEKIKEKFEVLVDNWKSWVMLSLMITLFATMVGTIADAILYPKVDDSVKETTVTTDDSDEISYYVGPFCITGGDKAERERIATAIGNYIINEPTKIQPLPTDAETGEPISDKPAGPWGGKTGLYSTDYTEKNNLSYKDYRDAIDELKSTSDSIKDPSWVPQELFGKNDSPDPGTYSPLPTSEDIKESDPTF